MPEPLVLVCNALCLERNRRVYDIALSSHAVIPGRDQESDVHGLQDAF